MREHSLAALLVAMTALLAHSSVVADDKAERTGVRLTVAVAPVPRESAVPGRPLGVMVTGVGLPAAGGVAYRAGIRRGDIIIRFNGHDINVPDDLGRYLNDVQPGSTVPIVILRNSQEQTVTARF